MKYHLKKTSSLLLFGLSLIFLGCDKEIKYSEFEINNSQAQFWLTNSDKSVVFEKQQTVLNFRDTINNDPTIEIDTTETFQTMDGFGFTLTGGCAMHISKMDPKKREALLNELFRWDAFNIGISYLRISIGASDLEEKVFSYDDLPPGEVDPEINKFNLEPHRKYLLPVLKQILAINPDIKIMATSFSPPLWMKTNNASSGGSLRREYYDAYAKYFVKYIKAMKQEGIRIDAMTIQNEPLNVNANPGMIMIAPEQAEFIKSSLGPAFRDAHIDTKIVVYDHNADIIGYPISLLSDPGVSKYVDGSAFHLFGGAIEELSKVHDAHPNKNIYFTCQWVGAPGYFDKDFPSHVKTLIINGSRNWSKTVLEWNLASDQNLRPHTEGGCTECLGGITIANGVIRNPGYYIIAHASKFVRPGSVRIGSDIPEALPNVAFKTPEGKIVVIVINDARVVQHFNMRYNGKIIFSSLNPKAVGTYVWQKDFSVN